MYRIESPENKFVEVFWSVFENTGAETRGWTVSEFYKHAIAYRDSRSCPTRSEFNTYVTCSISEGLGCELHNLIGYHFTFDDSYTEIERDLIRNEWLKNGGLQDKDRWHIEEEYIKISGGFKVDRIQRTDYFNYDVVEENVLLCEFAD
jgi:hypothetical protein